MIKKRIPHDPISKELRKSVLERDNYMCRYCGDKTGPFFMDHVYPFSKGGETTYHNLATACGKCNGRKHARLGIWPSTILTIITGNTNGITDYDYKFGKSMFIYGIGFMLSAFSFLPSRGMDLINISCFVFGAACFLACYGAIFSRPDNKDE